MSRRRALVLGANLALGALLLAWLLGRHGGPAWRQLSGAASPPLVLAFLAAVALAIVTFALRWRVLLAGLGIDTGLGRLTAYRAAGQSLSSLVPSARVGGDPLRAWLAYRDGVPAPGAIATVAVDRVLEVGAAAPFSIVFVAVLIQHGIPGLGNVLATVVLGALALVVAGAWTARRLIRGQGIATAFARRTQLDAIPWVRRRMDTVARAETSAGRLVTQRARLGAAFAIGLGANGLVLVEFALLLAAFGLPADPVAVVAAAFATAAASQLPVPAGLGVLEGGQMWLFQMLGHPPEVGLAVGLAARLRELAWALPGVVYLLARAVSRREGGLVPVQEPAVEHHVAREARAREEAAREGGLPAERETRQRVG